MQAPETLQPVLNGLRDRFPGLDGEAVSYGPSAFRNETSDTANGPLRGEVTVAVDRGRLVEVGTWLRDDPAASFIHLSDLSGTDYPDRADRLCVDYHLYSFDLNARLRLKVRVTVEDPHVPTVTGVWPTANWHEREVYDMFGIRFDGHPNLIRILMPEDWEGYPQRKDYPLGGVDVEYRGAHITAPDTRRYKGGWTST